MFQLVLYLVAGVYSMGLLSGDDPARFEEEIHDFGNIQHGIPAKHTFYLTNMGEEPLVITNVTTSCGCVAPDWSKKPVMPGEQEYVSVLYDTRKLSYFRKSISVYYKAGDEKYFKPLWIEGRVVK